MAYNEELYNSLILLCDTKGILKTNIFGSRREYEDEKIIVIGELYQTGNTSWAWSDFTVLLKMPSNVSQINPKFGLEAKAGTFTDVLMATVKGKTLNYQYYRPGKWMRYVANLAKQIEDDAYRVSLLNLKPVIDDDFFKDLAPIDPH